MFSEKIRGAVSAYGRTPGPDREKCFLLVRRVDPYSDRSRTSTSLPGRNYQSRKRISTSRKGHSAGQGTLVSI
ncbi:hypothetical protein PUN28_005680 [Cardiocondyla obscurior]|uniref:Uncharacterized protein n=1 Tax=Cardiocondyla obscurior TaxID=286306 RepID=A0AAW2G6X9_9HYME